jgi:hypothetical protein
MGQRRRRRTCSCGCKSWAQGGHKGRSGPSGRYQCSPDDGLLLIASNEGEQATHQKSQNAEKKGPAYARYQTPSSMSFDSFFAPGVNLRRSQVHRTWWALTPEIRLLEPRHLLAGPADASLSVLVPWIDGQHPSQIGQALAGVFGQASLPEESLLIVWVQVQNGRKTSTGILSPAYVRREDAQPHQVRDLILSRRKFEPPVLWVSLFKQSSPPLLLQKPPLPLFRSGLLSSGFPKPPPAVRVAGQLDYVTFYPTIKPQI